MKQEIMKNIMNTYEMKKIISKTVLDRMNDPNYKKEWLKIINTPKNIEKRKQIQSEINGIKLEYNGVIYRSKKELARYLKTSPQLLNLRLKNNIPLDAPVNKGNNFNKNKGNSLNKFIDTSYNKCCGCGEIKDKLLFSKNKSSLTGVRSNCKKCELAKRKK